VRAFGTDSPHAQSIIQTVVAAILLCLAVAAILWANSAQSTGSQAQDTAQVGVQACRTQVQNYVSSYTERVAVKAEIKALGKLHAKTANVFDELANLSRKASVGQTEILDLALEYSSVSANELVRATQIQLPIKPTCRTT
jgi:cell division protein FtsB